MFVGCRKKGDRQTNKMSTQAVSLTVIVPSIGRPEITRTLASLLSLHNANWKAIVGFDAVPESSVSDRPVDPRISYLFLPHKAGGGNNYGGGVRNILIKNATTDWVCFLDDDDTFRPNYVDAFIAETTANPAADVIMFRMSYNPSDNDVLPPIGISAPVCGRVGISFAVRKRFLSTNNIQFENGQFEDYELLRRIHESGGKIVFSKTIAYNIRF